jgi:hypothetical protein
VELPLLAERPTVSGRGRWDWKLPADETASLLNLLVRLGTGPAKKILLKNKKKFAVKK